MQADLEFVKLINEIEIELENEMAEEKKTRKPRKPREPKAETQSTKSLIEALKFLKLGQSKNGTYDQVYCQLKNHWALMKSEGLSMGMKIDEDLDACPHTYNLLSALNLCKSELQISQLSRFELNIRSGDFTANVVCVPEFEEELVEDWLCDAPVANIDNSIMLAFESVAKLVSKSPTNPVFGVALLQANSMVATDGCAILEYWHGVNLPPNMLIPKQAIDVIVGSKKNLKAFGISKDFYVSGSPSSITFYFDDDSWVRTELLDLQYVNYGQHMNVQTEQTTLPEKFFDGVKVLAALTDDAVIHFNEKRLSVKPGATFEVVGLPDDIAFNSVYLLQFEKFMKTVDIDVNKQQMLFYGDNIRGLLKATEV